MLFTAFTNSLFSSHTLAPPRSRPTDRITHSKRALARRPAPSTRVLLPARTCQRAFALLFSRPLLPQHSLPLAYSPSCLAHIQRAHSHPLVRKHLPSSPYLFPPLSHCRQATRPRDIVGGAKRHWWEGRGQRPRVTSSEQTEHL